MLVQVRGCWAELKGTRIKDAFEICDGLRIAEENCGGCEADATEVMRLAMLPSRAAVEIWRQRQS